ncbi:hypothetical protein AB0L63_22990 [Nocardia sp. NPDC051990]|uniref:hypothetical protein n=1 Tax=Nocardia sp. NPDC051990 TaxID=3155285 RepID=UPI0034174F51
MTAVTTLAPFDLTRGTYFERRQLVYPSQPGAPDGRHAAGCGMPGQPPRMVGRHALGGAPSSNQVNAPASFVTYAKALEALDKHHFSG